jgi:hypothetical protein
MSGVATAPSRPAEGGAAIGGATLTCRRSARRPRGAAVACSPRDGAGLPSARGAVVRRRALTLTAVPGVAPGAAAARVAAGGFAATRDGA